MFLEQTSFSSLCYYMISRIIISRIIRNRKEVIYIKKFLIVFSLILILNLFDGDYSKVAANEDFKATHLDTEN